MKFSMNSVLIILILSIILVIRKTSTKDAKHDIVCNKKTERLMDSAAAKLIVVGQNNIRFPETAQELRVYCNEAKKLINYVNRYSDKCLPNFAKQAARIFMLSFNKEIKIVCKSGKLSAKARELLNAASCGNAARVNLQKCNLDIIDAYLGIISADVKMRIPMACCHYHKLRECLITEAEEVKVCTKSTIDFVDRYVESIVGGLLDFLCFQYDESNEKCHHLVRETPKRNASIPRPKSFLPPVLAIAQSIGDIPDIELG